MDAAREQDFREHVFFAGRKIGDAAASVRIARPGEPCRGGT